MPPRFRFRLAFLLPLPLLAACAQVPPGTAAPEEPPAPAAVPAAVPAADGAPGPAGTAAPPPAASTAPPPPESPATLEGLSAEEVERALGTPGFRRRDPPAEIWQYRAKKCTLDVFLYDGEGGRKVAHVAVRGQAPASEAECLKEVGSKETERGR